MDLNRLYSDKRIGSSNTNYKSAGETRSAFQRDFDRIIFSSAFRRLQNKTQVFPLPGSVFVHNRLTHSLEVASVGRSLGTSIGEFICERFAGHLTDDSKEFYKYSLYNVIAAACLCHDIGNPAFGHSGEDAISSYFRKHEGDLKNLFTDKEWADLVNFEGNANAVRILTQQQNGKSEGGLKLTHSTIAAIAKYPCESIANNKKFIHRKKFGFFQSEVDAFSRIAEATLMQQESQDPLIFRRHPFVWLVEAADDICYNIIDLEDAHRLHIIEHTARMDMLCSLVASLSPGDMDYVQKQLDHISDKNDQVSYLRAKCIAELTKRSIRIYQENIDGYLDGSATQPLFDVIKKESKGLQAIMDFSLHNIYNHRAVVEIENAGYNVMYKLLSHFIPPVTMDAEKRAKADKKAIQLIPSQFLYEQESTYKKVMGVLDYVSGMTDNYATDLYRKIQGIDIGMTI